MKMVWKALLGLIRNNFWMKIAALGIAAVLWIFVISETNPPRIKEFHSLPVSFTNVETLKSKGLTNLQDLGQIIQSASATVVASTDQLKYIKADNIALTVDLSGISGPGEYKIPIKGNVLQGNVASVYPAEITVDVEKVETVDLPVDVQLVGSKKADLYYGEPRLSKTTVQVSGARTKVEKYAKAVCSINLQDLAGPVTENKTVQILDATGNNVQEKDIEGKLPSVIVSIDVYPKKEVPVDTQGFISSITGVAEGYQIDGVVLDPATVELAGPSEVLDKITKVSLEKVELGNAMVDSSMQVAVIVPQGVIVCQPAQVMATMQISEIVQSRLYQALDVRIKNLPSGLKCTLTPQAINVTVTGSQKALESLKAAQVIPFVDLSGLSAGTQNLAVQFENAPDIGAVLTPAASTVSVKLEKK